MVGAAEVWGQPVHAVKAPAMFDPIGQLPRAALGVPKALAELQAAPHTVHVMQAFTMSLQP